MEWPNCQDPLCTSTLHESSREQCRAGCIPIANSNEQTNKQINLIIVMSQKHLKCLFSVKKIPFDVRNTHWRA